MEYEVVSMYGGGIKCDNPNCDYIDMSVEISNYDKWLNKPCPKCGCNLLTQEDYDAVMKMQEIVRIANDMSKAIRSDECNEKVIMTARFNGTGKVELEIEE